MFNPNSQALIPARWVQAADPWNTDRANVQPGVAWLDITGGSGAWILKIRNVANNAWETITAAASNHNLFSSTHPDVDHTDTPLNGQILTYDSAASKWKAQPPPASGPQINSGLAASRPAASSADDLYLNTDVPLVARDTGSAYENWGPLFPVTKPPVVADWTWDNQGSATLTQQGDALYLAAPWGTESGTFVNRILYRTAPSTPYVITALLLAAYDIFAEGQNIFPSFFLAHRQSSDSKFIAYNFEMNVSTVTTNQAVRHWNSATSYNSDARSRNAGPHRSHFFVPVWMRIRDDGTNRYWDCSADGHNWIEQYRVSRTTFLTPDQVGWGVRPSVGTLPTVNPGMGLSLLSWKVS